mmetsp:Transcript_83595/g.157361  ORF Transcript_83595/g.157361 Transcript_83595/m.157361 type:complete len:89 (+) Transcript_83595:2-268(+)
MEVLIAAPAGFHLGLQRLEQAERSSGSSLGDLLLLVLPTPLVCTPRTRQGRVQLDWRALPRPRRYGLAALPGTRHHDMAQLSVPQVQV